MTTSARIPRPRLRLAAPVHRVRAGLEALIANHAAGERAALCDLLEELGPDAPTLCGGWTTADLAAHLVIRERRPDAGVGILAPRLAAWTDKVQRDAKRVGYATLVHQIRTGPPRWSFFALPGADANLNLIEYFVHLEDVRRAQPGWQPRELSAEVEEALWVRLQAAAPMLMRNVRTGVALRLPDGRVERVRPGPGVRVTGPTGELVLFAYGRGRQAEVELEGPRADREHLLSAQLGV